MEKTPIDDSYSLDGSRGLHVSHPEDFGAEFHIREMKRTSLLVPGTGPILDIGCGSGLISHFVPRQIPYVGIDFNLDYLQQGWKGRDIDGRLSGNILSLPFRNEAFLTVLLLHVIEHFPSNLQPQLIGEAHRILAPHGTLILSTPNRGTLRNADKFLPPHNPKHFHCLHADEVRSLLTTSEFSRVKRHGFDVVIEFPSAYLRLVPEIVRRSAAHVILPLEKHLIFTAVRT